MGMSCLTVFYESRLWECRVFTVFAYRQVRFDCIVTQLFGSFFGGLMFACKFMVFSESRLWECRVLHCFLRAVYGNVVFLRCFLAGR